MKCETRGRGISANEHDSLPGSFAERKLGDVHTELVIIAATDEI